MTDYKMIMEMPESTVVAEYEPQTTRSGAYQSEAALEQAFIEMLVQQGYEYVKIHKYDEKSKGCDQPFFQNRCLMISQHLLRFHTPALSGLHSLSFSGRPITGFFHRLYDSGRGSSSFHAH